MNSIKNLLPWLKFSWPVLSAVPYVKYEAILLLWLGVSDIILLRVAFCAIVLILIGLIVAFVYWRKNNPRLKYNQNVGAYFDKNGVWYCTSCKAAGELAPLLRTKDHELICQVGSCKKFYYLPEYNSEAFRELLDM